MTKQLFNKAQKQVFEKLESLYPDFVTSDAHAQFLQAVFKIEAAGKGKS